MVRLLLGMMAFAWSTLAWSAPSCPRTDLNHDWSSICFEGAGDARKVKRNYLSKLRFTREGIALILIEDPRELVAVDRSGKVVVPGIRHTGDFDYPDAQLGLGRFEVTDADPEGRPRTRCGYFQAPQFRILVPARYDACFPFQGGTASVCTDCKSYCTDDDCHDSRLVGGQGYLLAPDGRVIWTYTPPTLDTVCGTPERLKLDPKYDWHLSCVPDGEGPFDRLK